LQAVADHGFRVAGAGGSPLEGAVVPGVSDVKITVGIHGDAVGRLQAAGDDRLLKAAEVSRLRKPNLASDGK
jgi:hypothetical protein